LFPQLVPATAFVWLPHTCVPVLHEVVPGLQVVPHGALSVQDAQFPLRSQTWSFPQLLPAAAFV